MTLRIAKLGRQLFLVSATAASMSAQATRPVTLGDILDALHGAALRADLAVAQPAVSAKLDSLTLAARATGADRLGIDALTRVASNDHADLTDLLRLRR